MTHDDYCKLIGDQTVATYQRSLELQAVNVRLEREQGRVDEAQKQIAALRTELAEREAIIQKFAKFALETTPSLSKPSDPESE